MSTHSSPGDRPVRYGAPPPEAPTPEPTYEVNVPEAPSPADLPAQAHPTALRLSAAEQRDQFFNEQRAAQHKTTKKVKSKAPAGAIIPWFWSIPGIRYHIVRRARNRLDDVPEVGKRQRPQAILSRLRDEIGFYAVNIDAKFSFENGVGGSSKSYLAVLFGQYLASIAPVKPLVLPATRSPFNAATGKYAGIDPSESLSVSRYYAMAGTMPDRQLRKKIPRTKFGLMVVTEDPTGEIGSAASTISIDDYRLKVAAGERISDALFLDSGNDDPGSESLVLESARLSDVIVVVATPLKPLSLDGIAQNIGVLLTDPTGPTVKKAGPGVRRSGAEISTHEKASRCLVIISGVEPGEKPKDYEKYTMRADASGRSFTSIGFEGVILTLRKHRMSRRTHRSLVINPRKLTLEEEIEVATALVTMYRMAAQNQGFPYVYDPARPDPTGVILELEEDTSRDGRINGADNVSDLNHHRFGIR